MTETEAPSEKIQNRIRALLERAAHPETPAPEQELCQQRAADLMQKYRIDMALLSFGQDQSMRKIGSEELLKHTSNFASFLNNMMVSVYRHAKCEVAVAWESYTAVGYEEDLFYAGLMWSNVHMDFVSKMLPAWSDTRTFDQNIYLLKEAGKSWMDIVKMAPASAGIDAKSGSKLRGAYARWAKVIGAEEKAQPRNPKLWRESFVQAYTETLGSRLRILASHATDASGDSNRAALALVKDEDRVKSAFYQQFPSYDPVVQEAHSKAMQVREENRRAALSPAARRKEDHDEEMWARKASRRKPGKTRYADMSAWDAGQKAANSVDLTGRSNAVRNNGSRSIG